MNNTALAGIIVGAVVVAAAGSMMAGNGFNPLQKYAKVVAVEPAFETTRTPRQVCGDEAALAQMPAPAGGAAAPAPATPAQPAQPTPEKEAKPGAEGEEDCMVVYDTRSTQAGYDVTYELDGVQKVVRMDHDPGDRIPVEGGELVLSSR